MVGYFFLAGRVGGKGRAMRLMERPFGSRLSSFAKASEDKVAGMTKEGRDGMTEEKGPVDDMG